VKKGIEIPSEVAEGITLASLTDHYQYLKEETRLHLEEGQWLHHEDLGKNVQLIRALELLIPYYGGEV